VNTLQHVGVIMDGNRRWARQHQMQTVLNGHEKGVRKLMELCTWCINRQIPYLSVYAFSTENWNRSDYEINGLFALMERFFQDELQDCLDQGIRIVVVGDRAHMGPKQQDILQQAEEKTKRCSRLQVQVAISYGGRDELTRAVRKLAPDIKAGRLTPKDITEATLEGALDTAGVPVMDMVIRTGGHHRLSNFFIWQAAYAELYFTNTLWPDFTEAEFGAFVEDFRAAGINMGK